MIMAKCPDCETERMIRLSNYLRGNKTGLCLSCFNKRHKNGYRHEGYVFIKMAGHPRATTEGFVKRAILVLEAKLGRYLSPSEHTHHINGIRDDDRPENITAFTNSEHTRLHMTAKPNIKNRYTMALTQRWVEIRQAWADSGAKPESTRVRSEADNGLPKETQIRGSGEGEGGSKRDCNNWWTERHQPHPLDNSVLIV